jgi:hypothetical protein
MIQLTAEQIQENWTKLLSHVQGLEGDRGSKLYDFYISLEDRLVLYPASNTLKYHSCFPGGYVHHVLNVIDASKYTYAMWKKMGVDTSRFTMDELIFSAINHDLGKMGDMYEAAYLPSTDKWRRENLGEMYIFNTKLDFMSVPDRSLLLLSQAGIYISQNEWIAIKTHDGLYDQANEAYLKSYTPETKPRSSMPYILHQADMLAARIEFEQQYMNDNNL